MGTGTGQQFAPVEAVLDAAVATAVSPCVVAEVGRADQVVWSYATGTLTADPGAASAGAETVFDLASLTKVVATTTLAMRAVDDGRLRLADLVSRHVPAWTGTDRAFVTLHDLLAHCSGLTAHLPFFRDCQGRAEFEPAIATTRLEYEPRERALYSDLGFMLLGFVLEDVGRADLGSQFELLARQAGAEALTYAPPRNWRDRTAPAGISAWRGRLLVGEVHDDNGWALAGLAGHAGLFGTAGGVGTFARWLLRSRRGDATPAAATPETIRTFFARTRVPGSSRALGWDTMLPSSSCGERMHASAVGHTGFTGTSLWIDWEADAYFVLLTNRTLVGTGPDAIRGLRRAFHDAAVQALAG